ncbi:efflux RND transporter periplasmic adaptor subunit [Hanstruepera marina]|uniref:efflux RND transporter periplasmic adaptor subunit n=1 Tax=Hanstruepera marina TaxID=2873265 RepID=UPI001CA7A298|nr:efflux RND transporter periplasmic adaptor subunit [Hanstruepera marina]
MKNIYIYLIMVLVLGCGNNDKSTETNTNQPAVPTTDIEVTKAQFNSENMALGNISEQPFNETIKTSGMIDVPPHNKSSVSTFIGGYITKTPLLVGDVVKKGQLLVTLENPEFVEIQQEYLEVSEQLQYLKSEYDRQKTLYDENISSQKNFLKAESTYKSSLAHYNGLHKKLQMMNINPSSVEAGNLSSSINIYAPISGHVTRVNVSNGTYVSPSDSILEIIDIDHIHLELSVYEKDILKVKKGQTINFTIPEATHKTFKADVHLVGTTIDETTRRVKVHGHIDNEDTNFIVGMFTEAEIVIDTAKKWALQKEALMELDNSFYALILESQTDSEYHFEKVKLDIGMQTENFVEILNSNDLKDKTILVKGGYMLLGNGSDGGHSH